MGEMLLRTLRWIAIIPLSVLVYGAVGAVIEISADLITWNSHLVKDLQGQDGFAGHTRFGPFYIAFRTTIASFSAGYLGIALAPSHKRAVAIILWSICMLLSGASLLAILFSFESVSTEMTARACVETFALLSGYGIGIYVRLRIQGGEIAMQTQPDSRMPFTRICGIIITHAVIVGLPTIGIFLAQSILWNSIWWILFVLWALQFAALRSAWDLRRSAARAGLVIAIVALVIFIELQPLSDGWTFAFGATEFLLLSGAYRAYQTALNSPRGAPSLGENSLARAQAYEESFDVKLRMPRHNEASTRPDLDVFGLPKPDRSSADDPKLDR